MIETFDFLCFKMKNCVTCKKPISQSAKKFVCVLCNAHLPLEPICTDLSQVAINGIKELGKLIMLLCNTCVANNERDSFIRCKTVEKMNEKLE